MIVISRMCQIKDILIYALPFFYCVQGLKMCEITCPPIPGFEAAAFVRFNGRVVLQVSETLCTKFPNTGLLASGVVRRRKTIFESLCFHFAHVLEWGRRGREKLAITELFDI